MKHKPFEACLKFIEREGWKNFSFAKVAQDSGIPLEIFHAQFASSTDVMVQLFRRIDKEVLEELDEFAGLSPKDTLFDILLTRFEVSERYKPVLKSFWEDWILSPTELPTFACQGLSSMAWMLEAAGLESRGLRGLMRVQGLTTLYLLTLKVWLKDENPDLAKTMVFLDKGLVKLERAARFLGM